MSLPECIEAVLRALKRKKGDPRPPPTEDVHWSERDKFVTRAAAAAVGKVAFGPLCHKKHNFVSSLLDVPRSYNGIRYVMRNYQAGAEMSLAIEAFEAWRGNFTKDLRRGACGLPVAETKGHSFTLSCDGSCPPGGEEEQRGLSAVTAVRDTDRKLMRVWIMKQRMTEDNSFIPEADAAVWAAQIADSLLRQGATSTQCIGDSQAVWSALGATTVAESSFRVSPMRSLLPNQGAGWYLPRRRELNHLSDFFTHVDPGTWEQWTVSDVRPSAEDQVAFVDELFVARVQARQEIVHALPPPIQGVTLEESIQYLSSAIKEDEFYLKCESYMGKISKGLNLNVTECFIDAFTMHAKAPRLPILINRWLLGNIRTRKKGGVQKEIRLRCVMYLRREWKQLHERSSPSPRPNRQTKSSEDTIRDVVRDVEGGRVGRARRKLGSLGIFDISDPDVQDEVRSKYPQEEKFEIPGLVKGWEPMGRTITIGEKAYSFISLEYALDFKLPNGRAPGLSGLTYERLREIASDRRGKHALCMYAIELVNGNLPEETLRFYRAKHIVPLVKKEGAKDVRPIAVGDCIRRWAAIAIGVEILGHKDLWPKSDFVGKLGGQYGVGIKAGAETMFRVAEVYQARYPKRVTVKVDAANGYNALKRSKIWNGVVELKMPNLERYMATFYGGESLVVDGAGLFQLLQVMGVDQGDPLGPLLFAIGIWHLCREVVEQNPNISFSFFIDDLIMLGEAINLKGVIQEVREALASGNLMLSMGKGKQEIYCPAETKPMGVRDLCEELNAEVEAQGISILGVPCGSEEFIRAETSKIVTQYEKELTLLLPLAQAFPKHALTIYSTCTVPSFNYALRNISPVYMGEVEECIQVLDRAFVLHLLRRPCLDTNHVQDGRRWTLASLPLSMGGIGVRDPFLTGRSAYVAAWGDSLASQAEMDSDVAKTLAWVWRTPEGRESHIYKGLDRCVTTLKNHSNLESVGGSVSTVLETLASYEEEGDPKAVQVGEATRKEKDEEPRGRRQKTLSMAVNKETRQKLLDHVDSASAHLQASIRANSGGALSNAWVKRFDRSEYTVERAFLQRYGWASEGFSAEEFRAAMQIRLCLSDPLLNAALEKFSLAMCKCKRTLATDGWYHFLSCGFCGYTERHDALVKVFVKLARAAGLMVRGDKQSPGFGPNMKMADFEMSLGEKTLAYDVRVISVLSECYSSHIVSRLYACTFGSDESKHWDFIAARDDGAAAHMARVIKVRDFVPNWTPTEASFAPLDTKKEPIPEERRLLKHISVQDPARGNVELIPLVFEVGGRVAPEVEVLIKDLVSATVEAERREGPLAFAQAHQEITTSLSNKLMRGAARNIIRMRNLLAFGHEKAHTRVPDRRPDDPLSCVPTNWIPQASPLFASSLSVIQQAGPAPLPPIITPMRRGAMKIHVPNTTVTPGLSPSPHLPNLLSLTPTSSSLSTSTSDGPH
jgi:hypothetical protein